MLPHASSSSAREAHAAPASGHRSFSPSPEPGPSAGSRVGGGLSAWGLLKVAFAPSSALLNTIPTSSGPAGVAAAGGSTRGDTRRETAEEQTAAEQAARWHEEEREDGGAEEEDGESSPTFEEEEGSHETIHAATNAAVQREDSVSRGPTFHEGTDVLAEDVPTSSSIPVHPPSEHASAASARLAAKASSAAPGGGGKLQNRKSSALKGYDSRPPEERKAERIQQALAKIQDPDVRALLDPSNEKYFDDSSMREWPMEKLKAFVMAFEPDLIETFLQKVKVAGIRDPNAESIAPETAISWRNLYYSVNGTTMLQNVSGYVKPGMLVAVLGGPDAGITTLLDVLAGRTSPKSELMGDIFVNRRKPDHTFKRQVGYVQKQDTHLPQLTVSETLYFSARLRNPDMTRKAALMRVAIIMKLLGLLHTWNTLLGDDNIRGVSGGEKRRVSVGLELVAGHNLILADLPTNGLDSGSALSLLQVYKSTTVIGKSMLCSLVQPSPAIYNLLDFVCVLSKGAQIYFGPGDMAVSYFTSLGFLKPASKSVPQFLEELSAAPERFIGKASLERPLREGADGGRKISPLERVRREKMGHVKAREERAKALKMAFSSVAASNGHEDKQHGNGSSAAAVASNDVAIEMSELRRHPSDKAVIIHSDPSFASKRAPSSSDLLQHSDSPHARHLAWQRLVDGFTSSIFSEDIGWVLFNELMPIPHFARKENDRLHDHQSAGPSEVRYVEKKGIDGAVALVPATGKEPPSAQHSTSSAAHRKKMRRIEENASGFGLQYQENLMRLAILFYRDRGLWLFNFVKSVLIGLVIGTLFYMISLNQSNVRTRFGLFYFLMTFATANAQQLVPTLLSYRRVFQMHKEGRYYRPLTYYLALLTINLPIAILETFLLLIIVYPLAGLRGGINSTQFGYAYLMLVMVDLVARSFAMTLSSIVPSEALANILNGVTLVIFSIFSGYLNPRDSIPAGWIWAYYISYYTWAMRGLSINEHLGLQYDCTDALLTCQYQTGEDALRLYGMEGTFTEKWLCILWMGLFYVGLNALSAWALIHVNLTGADQEQAPDFEPQKVPALMNGNKSHAAEAVALASSAGGGLAASTPAASNGSNAELEADGNHARPHSEKAEQTGLLQSEAAAASPVKKPPASSPPDSDGGLTGGYISWSHLTYTVPIPDSADRKLLSDVFGYARPGMICALMGASGAGKSTLLDVLAGKKTGGKITGELLVNGVPRDASFFRIAGYVEQWDSHNEKSTVREAIRFAAELRLPPAITQDHEEIEKRVDRALEQVGLLRIQNDVIGSALTGGISQEARKKVTIAVELISEPKILFLDEPTTGLDSAAATDVMKCVVALSRSMSVLCTIHQPSRELIGMFNHMCLLRSGGQTVYFGPMKPMPAYFEALGMPRFRSSENLADYAISCAKSSFALNGDAVDLAQAFKDSEQGKQVQQELDKGIASDEVKSAWIEQRKVIMPHGRGGALASWPTQFRVLLRRFWLSLGRSPDIWGGRIFANVFMGFITGTCFYQLSLDQTGAQNRISPLFLTVQFILGSGALKLPAVFTERAVVFRERQAEMYDSGPYYLAKMVHDAPVWLVENFIFAVLVYFICSLNSEDHYTHFGLFYLLLLICGQLGFALSELVALVVPTRAIAYTVQGLTSTVCSLFSGFLISRANMPIGWRWMNYVSPYKYPLSAAIQNEMRGLTFTCSSSELIPGLGAGNCADSVLVNGARCPVACGEDILVASDVPTDVGNEVLYFCLIVVYLIAFRIFGFLAFKFINHVKR